LVIAYLKINRENTFSILCFDGSCCINQLCLFDLSQKYAFLKNFPPSFHFLFLYIFKENKQAGADIIFDLASFSEHKMDDATQLGF
jgi:hypothetical protein